jgi:hypothetical protein
VAFGSSDMLYGGNAWACEFRFWPFEVIETHLTSSPPMPFLM